MTTPKSRSRSTSQRLPDAVRLALRRYYPGEVSARKAAYYALPEHLALLRLRSEAEGRMLRWNDVAEDLSKALADLPLRVRECTAFTNSYALEILLHAAESFPENEEELTKVSRPPVRTARIAASFIIPYWTITFLKWRKNNRGDILVDPMPQQGQHSTRVVNVARSVLKKHGWTRIPQNLAQTKIHDIDLRNTDRGEVRVADIVFGESNGF